MSAFLFLVNTDGAPLEQDGVAAACAGLAEASGRDPIARDPWPHVSVCAIDGASIAVEGERWVVADARLDEREALARALGFDGNPPDAALILRAVARWGERCADHLLGDFAFVAWDAAESALMCARDPFGIRPLYVARHGRMLAVSNSLVGALAHPAIPRDPDILGVCDFLLTGGALDARTAFVAVERVLPAHTWAWSRGGGTRSSRYWSVPIEPPLRRRRADDYVDEFKALLAQAVRDRVREPAVAITLSGGMDSASVAALAAAVSREPGRTLALHGVCAAFEKLIPDAELSWARQAADHAGVPLSALAADDYPLFSPGASVDSPVALRDRSNDALMAEFERMLASHSRAVLTGYGGDPVLFPSKTYLPGELRRGRVAGAARGVLEFRRRAGRWPPLYVRSGLLRPRPAPAPIPDLPAWLAEAVRSRADVRERWERSHTPPDAAHPMRPEAYRLLNLPEWPRLFEMESRAGVTRLYPFFDLRLVRFALRVPSLPWFEDKLILREAMRGMLPEAVRTRRKTPLAASPFRDLVTRAAVAERAAAIAARPVMSAFIDPAAMREAAERDARFGRRWLGPLCSLADWLDVGRLG